MNKKNQSCWTREETKERFPDSISPLGWSALQSALAVNIESIKSEFYLKKVRPEQITRWIDGYLYSSKDFFKRIPFYHFSISKITRIALKLIALAIAEIFKFKAPISLKTRVLHRLFFNILSPKIEKVISDWSTELPMHLSQFQLHSDRIAGWDPMNLDFEKLMTSIENAGCAYNRLDFAIYFYKNILNAIIEKSAQWQQTEISIDSLTARSSFQIGKNIQNIIKDARVHADIQIAAKKLGHLSLSWDIAKPTFSERPDLIEKMMNEEDASQVSPQTFAPPSPLIPSRMIEQFISLVSCDEEHRFYASGQFPTVRKLIFKLANIWIEKKLIQDPQDIFFLTLDEVIAFHRLIIQDSLTSDSQIKMKIENRKGYLKPEAAEILFSDDLQKQEWLFFTSRPTAYPTSKPIEVWTGLSASPGVVSGKAFWVTDYQSLVSCPKDSIVLCESPSPNFNSAFVSAKAIASETGGLLSHGAIIARELGIPCLLQVNGLKSIKDGDMIQVNSKTSRIERLS